MPCCGVGQAVGALAQLHCAQRSDRWGRDDSRIGVAGDDRRGWGARHARGRGDAGGAGSQLRVTRFFRRHRPYACTPPASPLHMRAPKGMGREAGVRCGDEAGRVKRSRRGGQRTSAAAGAEGAAVAGVSVGLGFRRISITN